MGRRACTEPECLYKGALYLLPLEYLYRILGPICLITSGPLEWFPLIRTAKWLTQRQNPEYVPHDTKPNILFLKIRLQWVSIALHFTRLLGLRNYIIFLRWIIFTFYKEKAHVMNANTGGGVRSPAKHFIGNYSMGISEKWYPLRKSILQAVEWLIWTKWKKMFTDLKSIDQIRL
jgi:hypothetical protein